MKSKLAIFHMLPSGGGIRVAEQFASGLAEHFQVHLHRPFGSTSFSENSQIQQTVYPFPMWRRPSGVLKSVAPLFLMARLLAFKVLCRKIAREISSHYQLALVHNAMPVAAPPVLNYLEIPSLYFCYEYPRHIYEKDIIRRTASPLLEGVLKPLELVERRMDKRAVASADSVATFSTYMQSRLRQIYQRESSIVAPGVDVQHFSPGQDQRTQKFVLSVGALWPFKGHETSIRILAGIPKERRPVLRIIADREFPGYSSQLRSLADKLSVDLDIQGGVDERKLLHFYRTASMVLCCQKREPYGLVPLEAMACGTPVMAISQGGFCDNIDDGVTGFLFSGDPEEGSAKLDGLLKSDSSEQVREVASRGMSFVRNQRTVQAGVQQLIEVLESV